MGIVLGVKNTRHLIKGYHQLVDGILGHLLRIVAVHARDMFQGEFQRIGIVGTETVQVDVVEVSPVLSLLAGVMYHERAENIEFNGINVFRIFFPFIGIPTAVHVEMTELPGPIIGIESKLGIFGTALAPRIEHGQQGEFDVERLGGNGQQLAYTGIAVEGVFHTFHLSFQSLQLIREISLLVVGICHNGLVVFKKGLVV